MLIRRVMPTAVALIGIFVAAAPVRVVERSEAPKAPCCFKNPGYAGTCKVEPAEDETCASILAYLNNPMAEGKSYCGGTSVRQGWTETACEEEDGVDRQGLGLPRERTQQ